MNGDMVCHLIDDSEQRSHYNAIPVSAVETHTLASHPRLQKGHSVGIATLPFYASDTTASPRWHHGNRESAVRTKLSR